MTIASVTVAIAKSEKQYQSVATKQLAKIVR